MGRCGDQRHANLDPVSPGQPTHLRALFTTTLSLFKQWWPLDQLPKPLAFDHKLILRTAFRHLAGNPGPSSATVTALKQAAEALEGPWQQQ